MGQKLSAHLLRNLGRSNSSAPTAIHQLPVPIVGQRAHLAALLLAVFPPLIPADTRQVLDPLTRFLTFSSSRYQNAQQQNKTDVKKKVTRQVQVRMEQNTPVAAPQGFELVHDGLAAEVCRAIESWLILGVPLPGSPTAAAEIPWQTGDEMQSRRVAQFGTSKYDYENDIAVFCDDGPSIPIPAYLKEMLLDEVHHADGTDSVVEAEYTQCIINSYRADNEIPWHVDHPYFGEKVLVYTFGEARPLLFRLKLQPKGEIYQAYPRRGSKYILSGPARYDWEHSVPPGKGFRASITFRTWTGPPTKASGL